MTDRSPRDEAAVIRYRTEVDVPPDRYVFLQLPDDFPTGRATVTLSVSASTDPQPSEPDQDRDEDVEWWEEFDDDAQSVN